MDLSSKDLAGLPMLAGMRKKEKSLVPRRDAVLPRGCVRLEGQSSDACCEKRVDYVSHAATGNCGIG